MQPIVLTPWLEHLARHLPIARDGHDPEGVHQVRVAAGRLIVWLELGGTRVLQDDLRWLRGSTGRLRELDVLMLSDPPAEWRPWIEERRAAQRLEFAAALNERRLDGLLAALPLLPPLIPARASERALALARKAVRRGKRIENEPSGFEDFHRLRKALRRVRFAREWLGEGARELRVLQKHLGELNDLSVALSLLSEWPERERLGDYRRSLLLQLDKCCRKSRERWRKHPLGIEGGK